MHFNILGGSIVVLNSYQAAMDLLDKRGAIYCSRRASPAYELVGWGDILAFLPYGEKYLRQRKFFQQTFSRVGCEEFRPIQVQQTQVLLKNILADPERFIDHVRRWSAAVVVEIAYGHEVQSVEDPLVELAEQSTDILAGFGDTSLLDLFPARASTSKQFAYFNDSLCSEAPSSLVPGCLVQNRPITRRLRNYPFEVVLQEMAAGTARPSFLTRHLEEMRRQGEDDPESIEQLKVAAMHMYAAGVETTWSTIMNFIVAMLLHPEAQKKAQKEIDKVLGTSRLPDFNDRESLPYVECVVQESARWHQTAPLGVPHRSIQDDVYKGMYIPKGATVIGNTAAMMMDENVYSDAYKFRPERYLPEGGNEPYPSNAVYGFGRRICPGRHLADAGVWLVAANLLAAFEICPPKGSAGPKDIVIEWDTGLTSFPFHRIIRMKLVLLLIVSFSALYFFIVRHNKKKKAPLPPGPPAEPLLGHLRIYPRADPQHQLRQWSKVYGDVMHFNILGKPIIVLSSEQAATDLLDKRGAKYSDRPRFAPFELDTFHRARKLLQPPFTRTGVLMFQDTQVEQAHVLLKRLTHAPEKVLMHVHRFSAAIIMEIAYGHQVKSDDDRYVQLAKGVDESVEVISRAGLLQFFPFLKYLPAWFPGAWFVRYACETKHVRDEMLTAPFEQVLREISAGTAKPSFTSMHIEEMRKNGTDSDEEMSLLKSQAMHLWTGGAETTAAAVYTFIFAMVLYPEVQRKAQKEIDDVVGNDRLPNFNDRASLPYVDCVLQECRRWHPVLPTGMPHRTTEDDEYKGMFIPKGATVISNATALALDENVYHDPHVFRPERFLGENGEPPLKGGFFGYGRRLCIGRHLADSSLWIVAASIFATFDITKAKDSFGKEIIPEIKFTSSLISHPEPFPCNIEPRTQKARTMIETL
ncbi:hypothetical protein NM688_g5589 [Phlebia brevispora]|uniref:Uncharacterized protein n=1 Tax=Phlebia brevispora TaxID=194682 RepID=A0ACC1ST47_9APHY|nr:hypothetical protein NM688_g5589 [Phlebia brevispora]